MYMQLCHKLRYRFPNAKVYNNNKDRVKRNYYINSLICYNLLQMIQIIIKTNKIKKSLPFSSW